MPYKDLKGEGTQIVPEGTLYAGVRGPLGERFGSGEEFERRGP